MTSSPDTSETPDTDERDQRHRERMQRKKTLIDAKIDAAQRDCGVILVTTGNGKGKSSSAFGMVARALGHGMKVGVVQFIKGAVPTGEERFFRRFPDEVEFHVMGEGYTWNTQDRSRDIDRAQAAWQVAQRMLRDERIGLVVLDEVNIALKHRYLDVQQVIADLQARPPMQHVVLTGRAAPAELVEVAHTVTDMGLVRHAFAQGIRAQPGVEL